MDSTLIHVLKLVDETRIVPDVFILDFATLTMRNLFAGLRTTKYLSARTSTANFIDAAQVPVELNRIVQAASLSLVAAMTASCNDGCLAADYPTALDVQHATVVCAMAILNRSPCVIKEYMIGTEYM